MSLLDPGPFTVPDDEVDPIYRRTVADRDAWALVGATPPGDAQALGCSCEQAPEASEAGQSAEAQEAPEGATAS